MDSKLKALFPGLLYFVISFFFLFNFKIINLLQHSESVLLMENQWIVMPPRSAVATMRVILMETPEVQYCSRRGVLPRELLCLA